MTQGKTHQAVHTIVAACREWSEQLAQDLLGQRMRILPPEDYRGSTPEEWLAQDGSTRLIILAILSRVEWASLRFLSVVIHQVGEEANEETQRRSLAWLRDQGCISERQEWLPRTFFWEHRRQIIIYALTPVGATLLAQWRAAAREEAGSPNAGADERASARQMLSAVRVVITLAMAALMVWFGTMLLLSVLRP